jgi:hypothetical protein
MTSSPRRSVESDEASTLQNSIEDSGREIFVMQDLAPFAERFVRGEDHGSLSQMALVDHIKQHVRGIWTVRLSSQLRR